MPQITQISNCTGCASCQQGCGKSAIIMKEDFEGFLYPQIDMNLCVECGICDKICPALNLKPHRIPLFTYGIINKDKRIVKQSSSGGVFSVLAEHTINQGGVVFGAKFDSQWDVVHAVAETQEELIAFRGSKYVQSRLNNVFSEVKSYLKEGREVLFSGTPCQVSGLHSFLGKSFDNLTTVDFICHGVPSPKVWRRYKGELLQKLTKNTVWQSRKTVFLSHINFRDKTTGWKKYSFTASVRCADQNTISLRKYHFENTFMRGFLRDLYLRPSCHSCPSKSLSSGSDLTIADFWGVEEVCPELFNQDRGVSLLLVNTDKVDIELLNGKVHIQSVAYKDAILRNPAIHLSLKPHANRSLFFEKLESKRSIEKWIEKQFHVSILRRINMRLRRFLDQIVAY